MNKQVVLAVLLILAALAREGAAIWCYRCTSATPGCDEKFNWRGIGFLGESCPEHNDICVKVIEKRGAKEHITRDCLSALSFRTDIPADKYEGCRPAVSDVRLGHYVNHTIKEHDIKRDYYTDVTFCFCFLDHRCNGAMNLSSPRQALFVGLSAIFMLLAGKIIF